MSDPQLTGRNDVPAPALRRRRIRARIRRLTGAGTVLSAIAVAVAGAVLFGTDSDQPDTTSSMLPQAIRTARPIARTTPERPTRGQATPRPTAKARPATSAPGPADQLHQLGGLLRDDARVRSLDELRSASTGLDQAAAQISAGDTVSAEALIRDAFEKVADMQRTGGWQPSRTEQELLASFGYRPPATAHDDD